MNKDFNTIIDPVDLAWVAGLLEGEGCFCTRNKKLKATRHLSIQCQMTDLDVLNKIQRILGIGSVLGPYRKHAKPHYKDKYMWAVHGPLAYGIMKLLLPHMCERRSVQIRWCISKYDAYMSTHRYEIVNVLTGERIETDNLLAWCRARSLSCSYLQRTIVRSRQHRGWNLIRKWLVES